ncbi:hypothetical protein KBC04_02425 [Candidatus Babeliales bacterium]|nr:hypothetical protein [Candidatus Babeliales bacterium]MBP9843734.1 hypothetical protein [Candidatus Babeliales bacterium]
MDIKNKIQLHAVDNSIQELVQEAKILFSIYDQLSNTISKFETDLNQIKAYFPFKYLVSESSESHIKKPEQYHQDYNIRCYTTKTCWYLAWDLLDGNSKTFRLFLVGEEIETLYLDHFGEQLDNSSLKKMKGFYPTKVIFKKPLMESGLSIRLQYSDHIHPFIESFKIYLRNRIIAIENNQDSVPF